VQKSFETWKENNNFELFSTIFQSFAATCNLCAPQIQVPLSHKHSVMIFVLTEKQRQ